MIEINIWVGILALFSTFPLLISIGLSLREFIHEYKHQTLVLFKCCLLQPKVSSPQYRFLGFLFILPDAILWFSVREIMHDAIFVDILDTRSTTKVGGLRGSRI